ncbi:MAG TPA: GDP-L-fucose synthase [candidate division Zixibacteria bacterium]|nr:GDP-L-fucose synthase [candidate division Zixibacteria bacterium]
MNKSDKIYVAGHNGMVGSAIVRLLKKRGFDNLILRTHKELDLIDSNAVKDFFSLAQPDIVIMAAARVGGIQANIEHPAEFLHENLAIQTNIIRNSFLQKAKKVCFLGSSCVYPRECSQPMKEEYLLTGQLEPTNEGYALAKIAGIKMIEYYRRQYGFNGISLIPCNLYGTNDNFYPMHSHVVAALIRKIVDAVDNAEESVSIWGTGKARRELMHVDDAADAIVFFIENEAGPQMINIGWGEDISIEKLTLLVARKAGFTGAINYDVTKPDGMMRKCMDISRMKDFGFMPKITLEAGIERTINEYKELKRKKAELL